VGSGVHRRRGAVAIAIAITGAAGGCGDGDGFRFVPQGDYERLSDAGLYTDIETKTLAPDLTEYGVHSVLWSDGADKRRFLRLPRGERLDTTDMDHWELPVGAQLFKEFRRDGVLLETRLIERVADTGAERGEREADFWMGSFVWNEDATEATLAENGAPNVLGTEHDVPSADQCWQCHRGQPGGILGVGAVQLSHDRSDVAALEDFIDDRRLSEAPAFADARPPGNAVTAAALGYLHANCGHCHSDLGIARIDTDMILQVSVDADVPEDTDVHRTTVGVGLQYWDPVDGEFDYRVVPGAPERSGLLARMQKRDQFTAMPPFATEQVHDEGLDIVEAWIAGLPGDGP